MRLLVLLVLLAVPARALPPEKAKAMISDARSILGVRYELGGRLKNAKDGIDCQGLVFFALQRASTCGWKSWSVMPTQSIAAQELGAPVEGLAPVSTAALDASKLEPGDVIHFVGFDVNPAEPAIGTLDDKPVWVWHMALATGGGRFIVGDHFAGKVVELDLREYLVEYAQFFSGVLVTRMADGPKAERCRRHSPMKAPR